MNPWDNNNNNGQNPWNNEFGGGNSNNGRISERDRLEQDDNYHTRAENNRYNAENPNNQYGNYGNNQGGRFSGIRGRFGNRRRQSNGFGALNGPGNHTTWLGLIVVLIIAILALSIGNGGVTGLWHHRHNSSMQNMTSMQGAIKKNSRDNQNLSWQQRNGVKDPKLSPVYDKNNLGDDTQISSQANPEYAVYVYTGNAKYDVNFSKWALKNDKKMPIYRLDAKKVSADTGFKQYVSMKHPVIAIYDQPISNPQLVRVVNDPTQLSKIVPAVQKLANAKESGKYKDLTTKEEIALSNKPYKLNFK